MDAPGIRLKELSLSLRLHINRLSNDGRGVASRPGEKTVFVRGALPGETVLVEDLVERRNFCEARAADLVEASPDTVEAACPHAGSCGGCALARLPYERQLFWKESFVRDALTRIGGLGEVDLEPILPSPATLRYRNRVELAFGRGPHGELSLGMRGAGSHSVVETTDCALVSEEAGRLLSALLERAREEDLSPWEPPAGATGPARFRGRGSRRRRADRGGAGDGALRFCQLREGHLPGETTATDSPSHWLILLTSPASTSRRRTIARVADRLLADFPSLAAVIHEERESLDMLVKGERRVDVFHRLLDGRKDTDPALMRLPLGGRSFLLDAADFFQVNLGAAEHIVRELVRDCPSKPCTDLFCGVGAPGLCLPVPEIFGIEYSPTSVAMARRNALAFAGRATYEAGDCARVLEGLGSGRVRRPLALCDPPRGGLGAKVVATLLRDAPERILYVSCNPATLARDARDLSCGYRLVRVRPIDLFPNTPHVESVSVFERRAGQAAPRPKPA